MRSQRAGCRSQRSGSLLGWSFATCGRGAGRDMTSICRWLSKPRASGASLRSVLARGASNRWTQQAQRLRCRRQLRRFLHQCQQQRLHCKCSKCKLGSYLVLQSMRGFGRRRLSANSKASKEAEEDEHEERLQTPLLQHPLQHRHSKSGGASGLSNQASHSTARAVTKACDSK